MTLVDSLDSIFMLHAYALPSSTAFTSTATGKASWRHLQLFETEKSVEESDGGISDDEQERLALLPRPEASRDEMLDVSVVLTIISITVALLISIVSAFRGAGLLFEASLTLCPDHRPSLWGSLLSTLFPVLSSADLCIP